MADASQQCGRCGKNPATGFATVNGVRYCHGDDDREPTCYMITQAIISQAVSTSRPPPRSLP